MLSAPKDNAPGPCEITLCWFNCL